MSKSREEFLRSFARPRDASAEPSHTEHPKDYAQLSDEELKEEIKRRERDVRQAREAELRAYQELDAAEEGGGRPSLYNELRKRGIKPRGGHWSR